MCNAEIPWIDALPTIILELRTTYKEDIKASPAEMLFGNSNSQRFFYSLDSTIDPEIFIEKTS